MTAQTIVCFNQKGGAGKTTLSVHLAVGLSLRGFRTALVDMDEQETAMNWAKQAPEDRPFAPTVLNLAALEGGVHREIKKHLANFDFIVVDCPPALKSQAAASAMLVAQLALVPVIPAPADMWATGAAKELALRAREFNEGLLIRTVPNMVQRTKLADDVLAVLDEDPEIPSTTARLGMRSAFRECQLLGSSVHAVPKATAAIEEIEALVTEVLDLLQCPQSVEVTHG